MDQKIIGIISILILGFGCANSGKSDLEKSQFDFEETSDFIIEGEEDEKLSFDTPSIEPEQVVMESAPVEIPEEGLSEYKIEAGDTLMFIAFKLYGDYRRWRELQQLNELVDTDLNGVSIIKYKNIDANYRWHPKGNPYLIKRGDSLSRISGNVYGVIKRWPEIYNNNRDMIRDPNLIFAGFTLYYIPDRSLASE